VRVQLRNPDRVLEISGPRTVFGLLQKLDIVPESVLVIRDAALLTKDERLHDKDEVEIRPVLSGGSREPQSITLLHGLGRELQLRPWPAGRADAL
jgi:sulfur carrier protein